MAPKAKTTPPAAPTYNTFDDLQGKFCDGEIVVRLIHSWEARNFKKGNILMGVELLLIDRKSTTIQAFISANRIHGHKSALKSNSVYRLKKFMLTPCKTVYKVASHRYGICFTDETSFLEDTEGLHELPAQLFRLRTYQQLTPLADTGIDLFDIIGHIRLISGDNLDTPTPMSEAPQPTLGKSTSMVFLHVQLEDGETVRVYLWDQIAASFRARWNESHPKPSVLLLTTINPKTIRAAVALSSTSATRIYFDADIVETKEYLNRLGSAGPDIPIVETSSSAITKLETVTLNEIHHFVQTESPQVARFISTATIVAVLEDRGWNFISCTGCRNKMERTETKLICTNPICKKPNNVGLLRYRFEVTVRDKSGEATFVIFDDDGRKLAGLTAVEAMDEMREEADEDGRNGPLTGTPQRLLDMVGRTCKFQVKITEYNFRARRNTITVSRIVEDNIAPGLVEANTAGNPSLAEPGDQTTPLLIEDSGEPGNEVAAATNPEPNELTEVAPKRARLNN